MKFDWYRELNNNKFYPEYHFKFSLDEDEVRKVTHKYGKDEEWMRDAFEYSKPDDPYQMYAALRILQDATNDNRVDLGTNYKQKYEELVELLKPHKIDNDMSPTTTLKMILKYQSK
jgi:hypothetical protein